MCCCFVLFFVFFVGEENFLKKAFLPPHPQLSKTFKQGEEFFILHCAFDQTKLNFALFREGRPLPYGYVALSIVGEAFCLPLVSNLINTISEHTMLNNKYDPGCKFFEKGARGEKLSFKKVFSPQYNYKYLIIKAFL